jgi:hypothetical protein
MDPSARLGLTRTLNFIGLQGNRKPQDSAATAGGTFAEIGGGVVSEFFAHFQTMIRACGRQDARIQLKAGHFH